LITIQKIQILRDFEKLEKSSDKLEKNERKPEKLVGLPFSIQNLDFESIIDRKPHDKLEKLSSFSFLFPNFKN
jgi:hypothetical protein